MESAFKVFSENWTFDGRQRLQLEPLLDPSTNTCTSLVREYMQSFRDSLAARPAGPNTLLQMTVRRLHHVLRESPDADADLDTVLEWMANKEPLAKAVFKTMPYPTLRAAIARLKVSNSGTLRGLLRAVPQLRDIDEGILTSEEDIRHADNTSGLHLVTIQDLKTILGRDLELLRIPNPMNPDEDVIHSRSPVPATQMPFLDENRKESFWMRGSDRSFIRGMWPSASPLEGLDWSNVLLVGASVIDGLCCGISSCPHPLELRLYGLDALGATAKLRQIEVCWRLNAAAAGQGQTTVVRTDSQIGMVEEGSDKLALQIPLRVWPSLTAVLLDIPLDPWAVGFNGASVMMLPRCARAIETGYSILTTRLVLDHPILDSPMHRQRQVLKWSGEGFGIRVLPSYTRFLQDDSLESRVFRDAPGWAFSNPRQCPADLYPSLDLYRRVDGPSEPGAKTLRRIANQGQDLANRWLGVSSPLQLPFDPANVLPGTSDATYTRRLRALITDWTHPDFQGHYSPEHAEDTRLISFMRIALGGHSHLWDFEMLPYENFMRCAEIQRQQNLFGRPISDYAHWHSRQIWPQREGFSVMDGQEPINLHEELNNLAQLAFDLFIKPVVNDRTQGQHLSGYRDYLTGRVRLSRAGGDLDSVFGRLSLPLLVTNDIESELSPFASLSSICNSAAHIPGSGYSGGIPPVAENSSELGNMRYLHVGLLWQGLDPEKDEALNILRLLSYLTALSRTYTSCGDSRLIKSLRDALCLQRALQIRDESDGRLHEARLFRSWIMAIPKSSKRTSSTAVELGDDDSPAGNIDLNYLYPVPDELFWGPEFEADEDKAIEPKRIKFNKVPWWFRDAVLESI